MSTTSLVLVILLVLWSNALLFGLGYMLGMTSGFQQGMQYEEETHRQQLARLANAYQELHRESLQRDRFWRLRNHSSNN